MQLPRNVKRGIGLGVDILSIAIAMVFSYLLSFEAVMPLRVSQWLLLGAFVLCVTLLVFIRMGLYRAVVRYVGFKVLSPAFYCVIKRCVTGAGCFMDGHCSAGNRRC